MSRDSDPNRRFDVETKPHKPPTGLPEGAESETPPDNISDTGVEGGVDAPNEELEEPEIKP
ncbi:MAG: hypothetical protein HIU84_06945 [Acidobacteria bacterium]|nr:hypothetical protein [Acidobacteriota bacterium]